MPNSRPSIKFNMYSTAKHIRTGQINLNGAEGATLELAAVAHSRSLDIVLVQEQYRGTTEILQCGEHPMSGVYVANRGVACTLLHHLSTEHCTVVHIAHRNFDGYLVSAYFQYSHDIGLHLRHLENVMQHLSGKQVLIGVDSNAHSPMWFCERSQYTGRGPDAVYRRNQMEGFILAQDLLLHNAPDQPWTFSGPTGMSNIDLTLSTRGTTVREWTVHVGASLSDHQLITFELSSNGQGFCNSEASEEFSSSFRVKGVNWDRFCSMLHARMDQLNRNLPAQRYCEQYTSILLRTARDALGSCARKDNGKYEWWTPELDVLRKSVSRARRNWQNSRRVGGEQMEILHSALKAKRLEYKRAMKNAEIQFYRNIADSGNDDPWGRAYREASGRRHPPSNILNGAKLVQGYTQTTGETMDGLLKTLCPDDQPCKDTAYHREVRIAAAFAPHGDDAPTPDRKTVERIIRNLPNTAPGMDGITAVIIKWAWKATSDEMWRMYSLCISEGVFPDLWKTGKLIVLPKYNGKPLTDPKAYRPITLLPIMGKVLERVIISCAPCLYRNLSESQHGFTRGRSTVTALTKVNEIADSTNAKYVQLILLDISGAFDNTWWPMVILKAKQGGAPPNIYRILVSYFTNRRQGLIVGDQSSWKTSTMGCPQGSVLGPTLWNLLLDDLLKLPLPERVHMIAYADDVTIVIEANSRSEIERKACSTLETVSEWGARNRLSFSPGKSMAMTYKGKFQRPPLIRMEGASIAGVNEARVLGVTLDTARSYVSHANTIGEKAANCFGKVSRVSSSTWGIQYRALRVLYTGTYEATLTYAAAVWVHRTSIWAVKSALLRTQRPALILLTKAYRTTSSAALPVLAGVLPADLEVLRVGRYEKEKDQVPLKERRMLKRKIKKDMVSVWQDRWKSTDDGRDLFKFFPDISARLTYTWVEPDHMVSQILTGHGCFKQRLNKLALCQSALCPCGQTNESRDHALWECELYADARSKMLDTIKRAEYGPIYFPDLVRSRENFVALREFAHSWHTIRRSYEE